MKGNTTPAGGTLNRQLLLTARNRRICGMAAQGLGSAELAGGFGLSQRMIQRILKAEQLTGRVPTARRPGPPRGSVSRATPPALVALVCDFKRAQPGKGHHYCHHWLKRQGLHPPAPVTIWRLWRRYRLLGRPRRRQQRKEWLGLSSAPGYFQFDSLYLAGDRFAFCAVETHSRWAHVMLAERRDSRTAAAFLHELARLYPGQLSGAQTDNGGEFAGAFRAACRELQIEHYLAWVRCPDQNGKVERFNRTLREESLLGAQDHQLPWAALHDDLRRFLAYYNNERLHSALDWRTPSEYLQAHLGAPPSSARHQL